MHGITDMLHGYGDMSRCNPSEFANDPSSADVSLDQGDLGAWEAIL